LRLGASRVACAAATLLLLALPACGKHTIAPRSSSRPRTYAMGFSNFPPRFTVESVLANWAVWSLRADEAIFHVSPDWNDLIAGVDPDTIVARLHGPMAALDRSRGMAISVTIDLTDGLDRSAEAPELRAAGRSLTEPVIQTLARRFTLAVWRQIHPEHLALAAEVNLIRAAAPPALYAAVKQTANDAASDLLAAGCTATLSVSIQLEVVWGRLPPASGYQGLAVDLADFPFMREVPLSSYPYLGGYDTPEDIPFDYYSRVAAEAGKPVRVVEGGWASESVSGIASSTAEQARYVRRQAELLDAAGANAVFQLEFADLDVSSYPPPVPANLPLFVTIGLVDTGLVPKPALAAWDSVFARPRSR
jgi:hypothetical protein